MRTERECYQCGSRRLAFEPTPMDDEDGRRIVRVYRCLDCQAIDVKQNFHTARGRIDQVISIR